MFEWVSDPAAWTALLTLTVLEIVLGIDNVIFISILAGKLPPEQRDYARKMGLALALVSRIILLMGIGYVAKATTPLFSIPIPGLSEEMSQISIRDLILLGGGLFLIWKATKEIHHKMEGQEESHGESKAATLRAVLGQIMILDVVFSIDSVITAVGMANDISVMVIAVIISVAFMVFYSGHISRFVDKHPTVKILALAFLVLIGANLLAEGTGFHIPKAYTYFAMAFSFIVEILNQRVRPGHPPKGHA